MVELIDELRSFERKFESKQKEIVNFLAFQVQIQKQMLTQLTEISKLLREVKDGNIKCN